MRLAKIIYGFEFGLALSSLTLCACNHNNSSSSDSDNTSSGVNTDSSPQQASSPDPEPFHTSYDIAMRVRSVAAAINEGESIDSTDYNFSGVLTDGMGAPIFTDFEGMPGQWEVDVINSKEVKIRNIGTGDLIPGSLMEYVTASINSSAAGDDDPELRMVNKYESGDTTIEKYTYGHTEIEVETCPETLPTGEVGPRLEITLRYDTIPG